MSNYNSTTAVLMGLDRAGLVGSASSSLRPLIANENNYSFYRKTWSKYSGIPLLLPHVRDNTAGQKIIPDAFRFGFYSLEESFASIDRLSGNRSRQFMFWEWLNYCWEWSKDTFCGFVV